VKLSSDTIHKRNVSRVALGLLLVLIFDFGTFANCMGQSSASDAHIAQMVKKSATLYETRRSIAVFTTVS
jgi:hypothetical protein